MTVSSTTIALSFNCNGALTSFNFSFQAVQASDVYAFVTSPAGAVTALNVGTDYTINLNTGGIGGTISTLQNGVAYAWANGYSLTVFRSTAQLQTSVYENNQALDQLALMSDLDKLAMICQEIAATRTTWQKNIISMQGFPGDQGEPGEDAPIIQGPPGVGSQGIQGIQGYTIIIEGDPADDPPIGLPGPIGPPGGMLSGEYSLGSLSGTVAVNWANGSTQVVTITSTGQTVTFSNLVSGQVYRLIVIQGSGGSKTITTWPTITWMGGNAAPTLSTTAGKADILTFYYSATTGITYGDCRNA
jgi:hypothetical protein